jgi:hypothetical protein
MTTFNRLGNVIIHRSITADKPATPPSRQSAFWDEAIGYLSFTLALPQKWVNPTVAYSEANVSNPPTAAEITAAFGSPADLSAQFAGIINDNGAGTNAWLVFVVDTDWFYQALTKAV